MVQSQESLAQPPGLSGHLESKAILVIYSSLPQVHQVGSQAALDTAGSLGYLLTSCPHHSLSWAL